MDVDTFLVSNLDQLSSKLKRFYLGSGDEDRGFDSAQKATAWLSKKGVKHVWAPTEGAHRWTVWRFLLADSLPRLFR